MYCLNKNINKTKWEVKSYFARWLLTKQNGMGCGSNKESGKGGSSENSTFWKIVLCIFVL